ncbi:GNAT family N-acetyltransferase [Brassicibacter mesophilus]|uniref:GNAT family N-acetyltransferase n=1 Tax=Brassicibacter mesophilus TaxID=745119 RepID=UPI003D1DAFF2
MINDFNIVVGDVDTSIDVLREVAQWCEDNNIGMWKVSDLAKESLLRGATEENFCVGKIGEDNACSMILQWNDPLFWPEAKENEAGYIHKLCVTRKYSGMSLSGEMVKFAVAECKKRDIRYLRLDTGWSRKPLCKLYESLGFRRVGMRMLGDSNFALYEMEIDL